jgi:ankyrin repeat protein
VKLLHAHGAAINKDGWTPLHFAAFEGHAAVCKYLLDNNAQVDARAPNDETALMLAARNGRYDAVKLLLGKADPNLKTSSGGTALQLATRQGHAEVAQLIREAGARE